MWNGSEALWWINLWTTNTRTVGGSELWRQCQSCGDEDVEDIVSVTTASRSVLRTQLDVYSLNITTTIKVNTKQTLTTIHENYRHIGKRKQIKLGLKHVFSTTRLGLSLLWSWHLLQHETNGLSVRYALYLRNGTRQRQSYYRIWIRSHMWPIKWCYSQRPSVTANPGFR